MSKIEDINFFYEKLMKPPAIIKPHLTVKQMFKWLQEAPDEDCHKRRMAIWLIYTGRLNATKVAEILGVSVQAVWLWTHQYNTKGPRGLDRKGRGGRRRALLLREAEAELLKPFLARAKSKDTPKASEIKAAVERKLDRKVSLPYIYKLLARNGWAQTIAQGGKTTKTKDSGDFRTISRPWSQE